MAKKHGDFSMTAFIRRLQQPHRSFFIWSSSDWKKYMVEKNLTGALSIDLLRNDTYFTMSSARRPLETGLSLILIKHGLLSMKYSGCLSC